MISRETIDEVKNRVDIVDVISDFVSLKRSGQNYKALSPFNNEKTPSFFVVPAKGIFKDFSSGKGGDAITFIMEHEGMSYLEAIRFLAKKYGVEIKEEAGSEEAREQQSERDGLYILMNFAKDYYRHNLFETEEGKGIGLSYFRERGFNDRTIQKFELGYALDGWSNLMDEAIKKNYNKELLEKTGLVVKNEEGRMYDRFRGRVIFPVHNLSGKVIAFGARMMGKEKNQPKYINSPETDIYHKSHVLYGLFQGKNAIRQRDTCYLVEGYTDVLSMHQSDVENVVASSGTALTEDQIKLIRRFTENVTVLFDGDAAGIKAALRGIDLILKGGLNVRVVLLPDGEDPDSYSRKVGTTEFHKYLATKTQDFISFKAGLYAAEAGNDPIRKAESIKEIVNSIALIPDPVKRSVYLQETSHQLKIGEPVLLAELNKLLVQERRKREREAPTQVPPEFDSALEQVQDTTPQTVDPRDMVYYQERETIRLLMNYANHVVDEDHRLVGFLLHELEDVEFSNPVFREIHDQFAEQLKKGQVPDSRYLLDQGSPEVKKAITDLMTDRYETSPHWKEKYQIFFPDEEEILKDMALTNVLRFKFRVVQKMIEENLSKLRVAEQKGDWPGVEKCLEQQEGLKTAERDLASMLGIVVAR
ncbi:MAG: DNA primase [Cyclobacteriaceae bacterium]|nr:DNA primase [Cyclobacteriaceae bacterium]